MAAEADRESGTFGKRWEIMRRLIVVLLVVIGMRAEAQGDALVRKLFELSIQMPETSKHISSVEWSPNGNYLAVIFSSSLQLYDRPHRPASIFSAITGEKLFDTDNFILWYADSSRALLGTGASELVSWDMKSGEIFRLPHDFVSVTSYGFINDEILIWNGFFNVYDSYTGELRFARSFIYSPQVYSPDRSKIAFDTDEGVEVYDTTTWAPIDSLSEYGLASSSTLWSPDSQHLLVVLRPVQFRPDSKFIWTIGEGLSAQLHNLDGRVWWSSDGTTMAYVGDAEIRYFDTRTGRVINTVRHLSSDAMLLTSNDSYLVVLYGEHDEASLMVWDIKTYQLLFEQSLGNYDSIRLHDHLLYVETDLELKIFNLKNSTVTAVLDMRSKYANYSDDMRWMVVLNSTPLERQPAESVLYQLSSLERLPFDSDMTGYIRQSWSSNGIQFALYGGDANTVSVWEIIAD